MKPNKLVALITAVASALVAFLAWLIKYRKMVNVISGYDEKLYPDKEGLANWVGGTLLKTGITGLALSIAMIALPQYLFVVVIIFAIVILGGTLTTAIGANKYKVKD